MCNDKSLLEKRKKFVLTSHMIDGVLALRIFREFRSPASMLLSLTKIFKKSLTGYARLIVLVNSKFT